MAGLLGDDEETLRMLECSICMNYPRNAMESNCCAQVICKSCVHEMTKSNNSNSTAVYDDEDNSLFYSTAVCPLCRKPDFGSSPVRGALKRMIDNISVECDNGCGSMVKLGNIDDHEKLCSKATVACKFCGNIVNTKKFIEHLSLDHTSEVIKSCSVSTESDKTNGSCNGNDGKPQSGSGNVVDLFRPRKNSYGRNAKLGDTGKFYCGYQLEFACSCCNGRCGPGNGCNCIGCQQLDREARNLSRGVYVNSLGAVSFRDNAIDSFFCLRTVSTGLSASQFVCDGYDSLCRSCRGLNTAWNVCQAFRNLNDK